MTEFVSYMPDEAIEKDAQAPWPNMPMRVASLSKRPSRSMTSSRSALRSVSSSTTRTGCSACRA